ncbi:hypothetical protein F2Q69_00054320 [Brassica cretica]|uniref:Uncharacterized protein n=1 Tax=Brassica cretica TaxID=69181 RepID=A0A8S9N055_BRACR|nr:hypothetical protein F2Q69_00054320 [Brassica cretica]
MRNGLVSGEIGSIISRERENNLKIQRGEAKVRELSLSLAGGGRCGASTIRHRVETKKKAYRDLSQILLRKSLRHHLATLRCTGI